MANSSPQGGRGRYHNRRNQNRGPRKNERIRIPEIRVIGPDGKQIGIMKTKEALALAQQAGLDLVEISPTARPPVCRVLDYGKYMYEQSKKQKDHKQTATKLKEVKFRVRTDQHDYLVKLRHGEEFLYKGNKLKMSLQFRGRENEHKELGVETIKRAIKDLSHVGHADAEPKLVGRNVTVTMSPLPPNKRKLKWNDEATEEAPHAPHESSTTQD